MNQGLWEALGGWGLAESGSLCPCVWASCLPRVGVDVKSSGGPGKGEGAKEGVVGDGRV